MQEIIKIIISALVGAIVAYVGAAVKNFMDMRSGIDKDLREVRIKLYKLLWQKTKLLPQWPKATDVTYEKLVALSGELRDWYFDEGGVYLSEQARQAYGKLQETISHVVQQNGAGVISDTDYDLIREKCSLVRSELTSDLLSRRRAFLIS